jgi:hypothetical protein
VRVVPSEDCGEKLPAILAEIGLGDRASD